MVEETERGAIVTLPADPEEATSRATTHNIIYNTMAILNDLPQQLPDKPW
jgi:hypothetical protein